MAMLGTNAGIMALVGVLLLAGGCGKKEADASNDKPAKEVTPKVNESASKKKPEASAAPERPRTGLKLTADEFQVAWNAAAKATHCDDGCTIAEPPKVTTEGRTRSFKVEFGKDITLSAKLDKNEMIYSTTIIAGGLGSKEGTSYATDICTVLVQTLRPAYSKEERAKLFKEIGFDASKFRLKKYSEMAERGDTSFMFMVDDGVFIFGGVESASLKDKSDQ